jgi:hypothetical protein
VGYGLTDALCAYAKVSQNARVTADLARGRVAICNTDKQSEYTELNLRARMVIGCPPVVPSR